MMEGEGLQVLSLSSQAAWAIEVVAVIMVSMH
jgi:hypothetical protein